MARFSRFSRKPRFRRFGRKNQGTWFPVLGSSWSDEDTTYNDVSFTLDTGQVPNAKADGTAIVTIPLTRDYTQANEPSSLALNELPSLRDFVEGQEYILKRIVGSLEVFTESNQSASLPWTPAAFWRYVKVSAGFYVARAGDTDQSLPDLTLDETDPSITTNSQDPWIWRRTWILSNPANLETVATGVEVFDDLYSNRKLSDLRGPMVDTRKSNRRIRREQRVWFSLAAAGWDGVRGSVTGSGQPSILANLDIRIFGKMVRGKNTSAF